MNFYISKILKKPVLIGTKKQKNIWQIKIMVFLHNYVDHAWESSLVKGAIQVLRNAVGGAGGGRFSWKKRYEGVIFNVISVTRGLLRGSIL